MSKVVTGIGRPIEEVVVDFANEGYAYIGQIDETSSDTLRNAVDEVAKNAPETTPEGTLHKLSGLAFHPSLVEMIDWPPLLDSVRTLLSPNIYINHSHVDVHPPHPPTSAKRWHRDNGLMGRDMRLLWKDQPRVTCKVAVYLTDVMEANDGALEVVPRSHLDIDSRYPEDEVDGGVAILGPAGTVAMFDARMWHRRGDNLGNKTRRAMFMAYSFRWLTSRDIPFTEMTSWHSLSPVRRQLLGDPTVDPFYWAPGELPIDAASRAR